MLVGSQQEVQHYIVEPGRVLGLWSMACFLHDFHSCFPTQSTENIVRQLIKRQNLPAKKGKIMFVKNLNERTP
jgi:hypothetical protein